MIDLLHEIAQTLSHNKLRTVLTGMAVAWGIFMLIVLLGASRGVYNGFTSRADLETSSSLSVWGGYTTKPYSGYREGRPVQLKDSDKAVIKTSVKQYVRNVVATRVLDSARVSTERDYISNGLYGHFPQEQKRAKLDMVYGRFLNDRDLEERRKVMVLESKNARLLFGDESKAVGGRVDAFGLSWLVVGVYFHEWESGTYIPFTTAMVVTGNDGNVSELFVNIKNVHTEADGTAAEQSVRKALAGSHEFAVEDNGAVHIWNRFNSYLRNIQANDILSTAVWIIGLLTMLSGIVGVSNIMFVSVRERTHEIGIRRAIGAKPRSILLQIVAESVAITTIFGYVGVVFGTAVSVVMSKLTENVDFLENPTVDLSTALNVTVVLVVAGALAGLFPAIKATWVRPVEALRYE